MRQFEVFDVVNATGGKLNLSDKGNAIVTSVTMDSRKIERGSLFVAIKGERVDGHDFIREVFLKGASAVICDHIPENVSGPCVVVENTVKALQDLAEWYRRSLPVKDRQL